jgi:hypothetical protein
MRNALNESVAGVERPHYVLNSSRQKQASISRLAIRLFADLAGEVRMRALVGLVMLGLLTTGGVLSFHTSFNIRGLAGIDIYGSLMPHALNESVTLTAQL